MLTEVIGVTAMLEQTAEEAVELAQACLKLARLLRGENKVYSKSESEIRANLSEEMADVYICLSELMDAGVISHTSVESDVSYKLDRMKKRLSKSNKSDDRFSILDNMVFLMCRDCIHKDKKISDHLCKTCSRNPEAFFGNSVTHDNYKEEDKKDDSSEM